MSRALHRMLAVVLPTLLLAVALPGAQAADAPTSFVTMVSENGDYIGGGTNRLYRPGDGTVDVTGSVSGQVSVNVSGGPSGDAFDLTFAAPPGETLAPGSYDNAQRTAFRSAGHPGIDIDGDGRGCNETSGRFTVLDVAPDLSRLWLVYEQHCEGAGPALFGEVRYNEPGGDSDLLVAPDRIAWPDEYPGVSGRIVPVTLVNTGSSPVTVSDASVTDGAADFSVAGNTCTTVAVGADCTVYVGFKPSTGGSRTGTLTINDSTAAGSHTVSLSGQGIAGYTSWSMHSNQGDWIGQGQDYAYTPTNATIGASGSESRVGIGMSTPDGSWSATFESDSGHLLLPGTTFTGATRYPFNSTSDPGMDISSPGRGCNTLTGKFTVQQAAYEGGQLQQFAVTFEQHCEGGQPALYGSIAWHAADPPAPVPGPGNIPPPPVTNLQTYPMIGSVLLGWNDPTGSDWSDTVVRAAEGLKPPATVNDGTEVYAGRDGGTALDGLSPGTSYSFSVFPRNVDGLVGRRTSITVRGSDVSLAAGRPTVTYGSIVKLAGRLVDAQSRKALPGESLDVYTRRHGATAWSFARTVKTASDGTYSVSSKPSRNTDYEVYFNGSANQFGVTAGPVPVKVAPKVTIAVNRSRGPVGTTFRFSASVAPNLAGKTVVLQRRYSNGWHQVGTKTLSSASAATFVVRPSSGGSWTYRVREPAGAGRVAGTSAAVSIRTS